MVRRASWRASRHATRLLSWHRRMRGEESRGQLGSNLLHAKLDSRLNSLIDLLIDRLDLFLLLLLLLLLGKLFIRRNDLRLGAAIQRSVSVNESDLRANLLAFRNLIIDIGFGKSYADGRTVVTTDEGRA